MSNPRPKCALRIVVAALAFGTLIAAAAHAATTVPNHFSPNTTVKAAEVNANFSDLANAIDGKASGIEYSGSAPGCGNGLCALVEPTITSMGSISVTVPGPGTLLLLLSGNLLIRDDVGVAIIGIGETATAFSTATNVGRARVDLNNNIISFETFNLMHVVPVATAGTRTFHALVQRNPNFGTAPMSVGGTNLVALFIPTRL
jgi:hypothetical protein